MDLEKIQPYFYIKREDFDKLKELVKDPSVKAYRGKNVWDDSKVHENWDNCRNNLSDIKDILEEIENDNSII